MISYERARQRTRTMIIDATIDLLMTEGYSRLSITRIADCADIGRGTFYRYFESVDAVILSVFETINRLMYEEVMIVLSKYQSPEREEKAWICAFCYLEGYQPLLQKLEGSSLELWEEIARQNFLGFSHSLESNDLLYTKMINLPVDVMAYFTSGAIMSVTKAWIYGDLDYSGEEVGRMIFKLLYHR